MTQIPEPVVTMATLTEWYNKKKELAAAKASEMLLRTRIFKHFFKEPKEGSGNWADMPDGSGYRINGEHKITRTIDEPILLALWEELSAKGLPMNDLIRRKPELNITEYRTLTEEQRKLFDQCLTIKDGSPALEIKPPKAAKA